MPRRLLLPGVSRVVAPVLVPARPSVGRILLVFAPVGPATGVLALTAREVLLVGRVSLPLGAAGSG